MNDIANKKFLFEPLLLLIICISNKPEIKNKIRALLDLPSKDREVLEMANHVSNSMLSK